MNNLKEIIVKSKILICIYIMLGIILAFLNNFLVDYFKGIIDRFSDGTLTALNIAIYGSVLILLCILSYVDEYPGRKLENEIFLNFRIKALRKISKIDYRVYQKIGIGKLVQRIENGAYAGKSILFDYYFRIARDLLPSILFSMMFIYRINRTILYAILLGYVIVFIITNILLKALYRVKEHILTNEEKMNHYLVRGFMEMVVFRINKRFDYEIKKASDAKNEIVNSKVKMTLIHEAFFAIFALVIIFIKIGIIAYGWVTKSLTIGSVVALIYLVDNAYQPIAIFNVLFVQYKLDKMALSRFEAFLYSDDDKQLEQGEIVSKIFGDITCEKLSFDYGNREIFDDLEFRICHGENVALVGESGSGKSTMIKLLVGLLKPKDGTILVDKYDLANLNLNSYYDHISYISQESPVFDGTLKENLIFDKEVDEKQILNVLKNVRLSELYVKLEHGLNTELGERGISLSGGERQRLALARLWFENPDIVILDEATSAMDNIMEEDVMNNVMDLLKDKTVIAIAHRLNYIKTFKKILAIKQGKIIGEGSFDELMSTNAYFKELFLTNNK